MVTREDLQQKYSKVSTNQLLDIINNKNNYTELAYTVALEEFEKRNVSEGEINEYRIEKTQQLETYIIKNIYDDLSFIQKNLFFFLWLPILNFAFKMNFREDGSVLKLKQANYYSLLGFLFFIAAGIVSSENNLPDWYVLAIWIAGFIPAFLFDEYFNRQKLIKKLEALFPNKTEDGSN